ncbi:annexin B9-like [Copidosoma floridanum]|uniref:annexin B9-like n=1 Tax=Copidosoma floridanum TaxID=29053 RepID=UPI0006C94AC7|nr:annexin B9-like [Copidosoma floridanum]
MKLFPNTTNYQIYFGKMLTQTAKPTFYIIKPFNSSEVAETLWKYMRNLTSYQHGIIDILKERRLNQREKIIEAYQIKYNQDLVSDLKSSLPVKFEDDIVTLTTLPRSLDDYAKELHLAIFSSQSNEKVINASISILMKHSADQRINIAEAYKTLYKQDLLSDLKIKSTGKQEDIIVALMTPLPDFYAKELHDSMLGLGTDEDTIIEILFTLSNEVIMSTDVSYEKLYGRTLQNDLIDDTSGYFKQLLVFIANGRREMNQGIDYNQAKVDAEALFTVDERKWVSDQSKFKGILGTRSYQHLRQTFIEYKNISGHEIEEAINGKSFSTDFKKGLLEIVKYAKSKIDFFAERLHDSIGINDRALIRIIVTRREIDLKDIKEAYQERYKTSLESRINKKIFGAHKDLLLLLVSK